MLGPTRRRPEPESFEPEPGPSPKKIGPTHPYCLAGFSAGVASQLTWLSVSGSGTKQKRIHGGSHNLYQRIPDVLSYLFFFICH